MTEDEAQGAFERQVAVSDSGKKADDAFIEEVWENEERKGDSEWRASSPRFSDRVWNAAGPQDLQELNKTNWLYSTSRADMDTQLARGQANTVADSSATIRRRRWTKNVIRKRGSRVELWGWLGHNDAGSHHWRSRRCFLVNSAIQEEREGESDSILLHDLKSPYVGIVDTTSQGGEQLCILPLTSSCTVQDNCELSDKEQVNGLSFRLQLSLGLDSPHMFIAFSNAEKDKWSQTLHKIIAKSPPHEDVKHSIDSLEGKGVVLRKSNHIISSCCDKPKPPISKTNALGTEKFAPPAAYKVAVLDVVVNVAVDDLFDLVYASNTFEDELFENGGVRVMERSDWSPGLQAGARRKVVYRLPRNGILPANTAIAESSLEQMALSRGFQVDTVILNPEVPYGKTFKSLIRVVLEPSTKSTSRLRLSLQVDFLENIVFKGIVNSATCKELSRHYKQDWFPCLLAYINRTLSVQAAESVVDDVEAECTADSKVDPSSSTVPESRSEAFGGVGATLRRSLSQSSLMSSAGDSSSEHGQIIALANLVLVVLVGLLWMLISNLQNFSANQDRFLAQVEAIRRRL